MKRWIATSLLFGYLMFVPFCFLGATAMASMSSMDMIGQSSEQMGNCEMPMAGCAHVSGDGVMDFIEHHVSMYHSISQTPLMTLLAMATLATAFVFIALLIPYQLIGALLARQRLGLAGRKSEKPQNNQRQLLLSWLSLFETSPNFA